MENKEKCKIVQDLLPNYIDKLTSDETNSFVAKHLEECTECTEIIENMKKNFEKESTSSNPTERAISVTEILVPCSNFLA